MVYKTHNIHKVLVIIKLLFLTFLLSSFQNKEDKLFALTVKVADLKNSDGVVQFVLYNNEGSIPDEHLKKYYRKLTAKITNGTSELTFENLPSGKYAVNILHDENSNCKVDKGFILPIEGIGFSNYQTIGISNRPTFAKASFDINGDKKINVKVIYL